MDDYEILGLPSGEEGAKLTETEISKAYKKKALELHPDKRPDDPNAHHNFQKLKSSYEILKDDKARKLLDDLLRVKRERYVQRDSKRKKMVSEFEARERAAFAPVPVCKAPYVQRDSAERQKMVSNLEARERAAFVSSVPVSKARQEDEIIARKLKEEIERIRATRTHKDAAAASASTAGVANESVKTADSDREKMLKVTWEKGGEEYTAQRLKELFSKFGEVEDVVIRSSKKKRSALVQMANKEAAAAATRSVSGNLSNPLLVLPVKPTVPADYPSTARLNNLVGGIGYKLYEDSILEKLKKVRTSS